MVAFDEKFPKSQPNRLAFFTTVAKIRSHRCATFKIKRRHLLLVRDADTRRNDFQPRKHLVRKKAWEVRKPGPVRFRAAIIYLAPQLPVASSDQPERAKLRAAAYASVSRNPPATCRSVCSCSRWGLPSSSSHPELWWALTPPFHPY